MSETIIIRAYEQKDDIACRDLELRASQHRHIPVLSNLIKVHQDHLQTFASKAKSFPDGHIVLVAEHTPSGTICGAGCVGIKHVFLAGVVRSVGYLFDLRIRDDFQRRGIGTRLTSALENRCCALNVEVLYLTVNKSNAPARALYQKYGYNQASERTLLFELLVLPRQTPSPERTARSGRMRIQCIESKDAAQMVYNNYKEKDLCLKREGMETLFRSSKFLACWTAESDDLHDAKLSSTLLHPNSPNTKSFAALTLWDGDGLTSWKIERIFLRAETWSRKTTQGIVWTAISLAFSYWGYSLYQQATFIRPNWIQFCVSAFFFSITLVSVICVAKLICFIKSRARFRARAIMPIASGPRGIEMLHNLFDLAKDTARHFGFSIMIVNLDVRSTLLAAFSKKKRKSQTIFLQKWFNNNNCGDRSQKPGLFHPDNLFDPRDLS